MQQGQLRRGADKAFRPVRTADHEHHPLGIDRRPGFLTYGLLISAYEKVDWGPIFAGYVGVLLIGALFLAIGIFSSAMTKSQLVAAMMSVALLFLLFLMGVFEELVNNDAAKKALGYVGIWNHIDEFASGVVDTRRLVFYLSGTLFFLFLATRALEDKKWR